MGLETPVSRPGRPPDFQLAPSTVSELARSQILAPETADVLRLRNRRYSSSSKPSSSLSALSISATWTTFSRLTLRSSPSLMRTVFEPSSHLLLRLERIALRSLDAIACCRIGHFYSPLGRTSSLYFVLLTDHSRQPVADPSSVTNI